MRNVPMRRQISLNGEWQFQLDPYDKGGAEGLTITPLNDTIQVPGTWLTQDKTQSNTEKCYTRGGANGTEQNGHYLYEKSFYFGTVWYAKEIEIPETDDEKRVFLVLEGITPSSEIYMDGRLVHIHEDGPWLPARVELKKLQAGMHHLSIRVTQRFARLQGLCKSMVMGLWKDVYLEVTESAYVTEVFAQGNPENGLVTVEAEIDGACPGDFCEISVEGKIVCTEIVNGKAKGSLQLKDYVCWTEHTPQLYMAVAKILRGKRALDEMEERFGIRSYSTREHEILINGKPVFMRGCGIGGRMKQDDTRPRLDRKDVLEMMEKARSYGTNWMRWHSGFWPEECLDVADEMGMMMSQELFMILWTDEQEQKMTLSQWTKLIRRYRNHPSIWIWSMGNEMGSSDPQFISLVADMYKKAKELCPQTLVSASDGIDRTASNRDYNDVNMVSPGVGVSVSVWLDMGPSTKNDLAACKKPLVVHELGYIEGYPDIDLAKNDQRWWMHALGHEMLRTAKEKNISEKTLRLWQKNSEKLCATGYWTGIENLRRVDGVSGYNQWIFIDTSEECSGFVREDLSDKSGMSPERVRQVNGETVVLMSPLEDRYTLEDGGEYRIMLHVSHHGTEAISGTIHWKLKGSNGKVLDSGEKVYAVTPVHSCEVGPVVLKNPKRGFSDTLTLELEADGAESKVCNFYHLWSITIDKPKFLPKKVYQLNGAIGFVEERTCHRYGFIELVTELQVWELPTDSVLIANTMLPSVVDFVKRGGRVLYIPVYYLHGSCAFPSLPSKWGNLPSWAGTNDNGGSVIEEHPLMTGIPHDGWADLQFFDLLSGMRARNSAPYWNITPSAIDLEKFPRKPQAIIRSLAYPTKLNDRAHLIELGVGKGSMIAATLRIFEELGTHPECQRFLDNALSYIASENFSPEIKLSEEEFDALLQKQGIVMD